MCWAACWHPDEYVIDVKDLWEANTRSFSRPDPQHSTRRFEALIEGLVNGHEYEFSVEVLCPQFCSPGTRTAHGLAACFSQHFSYTIVKPTWHIMFMRMNHCWPRGDQ